MTVTRRFCACGRAFASQTAAFLHFDEHRPGCREISASEHAARFAPRRAS